MRFIFSLLALFASTAIAQTLTVSPTDATAPAQPTLTWDFTGGTGCTSTGNWGGARDPVGTIQLEAFPAGTHTFTLSCKFTTPAQTTVDLTWNPCTSNTDGSSLTDLAGYRLFYGASDSDLAASIDIPDPSLSAYRAQNMTAGTWFFGLKCYNTAGVESDLSNVVSKTLAEESTQTVSQTVTWTVKAATKVPSAPTNLAVAESQIAGLESSLVFKLTATGKRSTEIVGAVPVGTACSGNVLFYYRDKPYRKVSAASVKWWPGIVPSDSVAAQCKTA